MKIFKFASVALLMAFCGTCFGQEDFPFSEVKFKGAFGTLIASENVAKVQMNGIWSEKFEDLRDTEEITPLSEVAAEILANQGKQRASNALARDARLPPLARAPPVQRGTAPR